MSLRLSRTAFRVVPLLVVLAVTASCTLQVGGGGKPSALTQYVGANGLLADPVATVHRPSLQVTLDRLWAARLLGVPSKQAPAAAMVESLADDADAVERTSLQLRWAAYREDAEGVRQAVDGLRDLCRTASPDATCAATVRSVRAFLHVTRSSRLAEVDGAFPEARPIACPGTGKTLAELFQTVVCGKAVTREQLDGVLSGPDGDTLGSDELFAAAVIAHESGIDAAALREKIEASLEESQVQGIYFDETPAQGTLLTTWALLHLAGPDRQGLDTAKLETAVRGEDTGGAPDRVMLARAGLALLHGQGPPAHGGPLRIADPDGPYNPFIAMAARDSGDLSLVSMAFTQQGARGSATALASWAITQRVLTGNPVTLTSGDVKRLVSLAKDAADQDAPVLNQLSATALSAGGEKTDPPELVSGCGGAAWLISTRGTCDIRASLLADLYHEFTTRQGPR